MIAGPRLSCQTLLKKQIVCDRVPRLISVSIEPIQGPLSGLDFEGEASPHFLLMRSALVLRLAVRFPALMQKAYLVLCCRDGQAEGLKEGREVGLKSGFEIGELLLQIG